MGPVATNADKLYRWRTRVAAGRLGRAHPFVVTHLVVRKSVIRVGEEPKIISMAYPENPVDEIPRD